MASSRYLILTIRSMCLTVLALTAGIFLFQGPVEARALYDVCPGIHMSMLEHYDLHAMQITVADHVAVEVKRSEPTVVDSVAPPDQLKPEYAESYDTHGLNFIDLRRRC